MKTYSFEKLDVWKMSRALAVKIYKITRDFPDDEKFGLVSQLRRAGISISSNIAEGTSRTTKTDQARFYKIAYGSLMEVLNQIIISSDLEFISPVEVVNLRGEIDNVSYKLTSLKNVALKKQVING